MSADADRTLTAVDYEHSPSLTAILGQLGASLVISTYQAGKVITVGVHERKADIRFYHFEQAMVIARTPTGLAVGSRRQIWTLAGHPDLGPRVAPAGKRLRQRPGRRGTGRGFLGFFGSADRNGFPGPASAARPAL